MDEQPSQESARGMIRIKTLKAMLIVCAPLIAVGCGLLLGYFSITLLTIFSWMHDVPYFFDIVFPFPFCLGIAVTLTEVRRKTHLISHSVARGLLVWLGMGLYWWPITSHADDITNAECAHMYCHVSGIETGVLFYYLIYGAILVLIASAITGLIIKLVIKYSRRTTMQGTLPH